VFEFELGDPIDHLLFDLSLFVDHALFEFLEHFGLALAHGLARGGNNFFL
jgi:hypothetical protein